MASRVSRAYFIVLTLKPGGTLKYPQKAIRIVQGSYKNYILDG
jgi:hypothetical protein